MTSKDIKLFMNQIDKIHVKNVTLYDTGELQSIHMTIGKEEIHNKYHKNGQIEDIKYYKNDKQEGIQKKWFPGGQKMYTHFYKNDKQEGIQKAWWENGQKKSATLPFLSNYNKKCDYSQFDLLCIYILTHPTNSL